MDFSLVTQRTASTGFTFLGFFAGAWARLSVLYLRTVDKVINEQTGTSYSLLTTDCDGIVRLTNASAIALTVPTQTLDAWPIGGEVMLIRGGAGQITVAAGSGQTVRFGNSNRDNFNGTHAVCWVRRLSLTEWIFYGDTATS